MNRLTDHCILVTGAGSGIGQATALRLADEGARVAAVDIDGDGLAATLALASDAGTAERIHTAEMNIGDEDSVIAGVAGALDQLGNINAVVNAAGILRAAHTDQMSLDAWNHILTVNLTGTFLVVREALPALLNNPTSVIVNFSSTSAEFAHPYMAAYAASKGGIQSFTHSLALEYSRQGLRAVNVCPGSIKSGITDGANQGMPADMNWELLAKLSPALSTSLTSGGATMGSPDAVAGVVAMLVSSDGEFITGTEIRIDGGTHA